MKLILRSDVETLGRVGDIVTVKSGYGRNYLIPQGLANLATKANIKQFELERNKLEAMADKLRTSAKDVAARIEATSLEITVRVGEGDKLYGSVTSQHIGEALDEKGIEIDRRKIVLSEPIRALGEYKVEIRLHPDVYAEATVNVLRHGQSDVILEEEAVEAAEAEETEAASDAEPEADADEQA